MGDRRKVNTALFIVIAGVITACCFVFAAEPAGKDKEATKRALFYASELVEELRNSDIRDKEVVLKKARYIKEKLQEEYTGNPTGIKKYKPLMKREEDYAPDGQR